MEEQETAAQLEAKVVPTKQEPAESLKADDELTRLQQMTADSKVHEETMHEEPQQEEDDTIKRSIYVGNVDYGSTPQELVQHFASCGKIQRVTIMVDKMTGHPKGYAYIEFAEEGGASSALALSNTTFRDRVLKVLPKRKNIAGYTATVRGGGRRAGYMPMYGMPYGPAATLKGFHRGGRRGGIRGGPF
ncbi:RNA recognition motif protein [Gregarina niphandrodes]|uniref:RNA recognition motif protein n=1 Tax=Gregarina niphandrodes TaxID=110365 RepID=A0A023B517_GRENI|nr:RNA recognition motif protein [Gregarina niphandrodes]EZG57857.1 RNA recognition motif protein [Gregarina niphandrodes]|eukprot:XP_011131023.1 RNA recognition motif protein [Gregarina niphandrodes]